MPSKPSTARNVGQALSRRRLLSLLGLGSTALALGGCGSPQSPTADTRSQPAQLVYQDWQSDWFTPMVQEMLEVFHEAHPNIRVFYTPAIDVEQNMLPDMQAGTAPDVFTGCCTFFPIWAQQGYTLDLRPYVRSDLDQTTIADWAAAQYQSLFLKDGVQYGLPKYHGALALYFNKDLFDRYGVAYPDERWDHGDYLSAMQLLSHDRDGDGAQDLWGSMVDISWDRLQIHINGWGGHLVDPDDSTRCRMADSQALEALEWIRARMWDDRVMASFLDVQNVMTRQAFTEQKVAMVEDGSWALKDILNGAGFRVGVAPFPAGPDRRVTLATTDGWGIYAQTKYPDAAWEFLKFLISQDFGRAMARTEFLQPARASLIEDWVNAIRAQFPEKAKDVNIAAFADGHLKGYSVTAEIFENMALAKSLTYSAWDEIFTLGRAPVSTLQEVCRQIDLTQKGT